MRQLTGMDALHVLEETPRQHMHTVKIAVLGRGADGPVSADVIRAWAAERLVRIPPLRWRLRKIPVGLGRPVFVDAGPIDVQAHIRVARLSLPGSDEQLDEVVSQVASRQLPRDRPLWELTIVEGLSDDRVALVFKLHHAIMDGQACVRFFDVVFDGGDLAPYGPVPARPEPEPSKRQLASFALRSQGQLYGRLPAVTARSVRAMRGNIARKQAGAPPVVNPMSGPATPFNRLVTPERVYVDVTVPFRDIQALKDAAGCTVNEVFVTLCGGTIRRYLEAKGELPEQALICAHPVSLRRSEQVDDWGNRSTYWYVGLGTDVSDPLERLRAVKDSLDAAREWAQGDQELFAAWQDYYFLFGVMTLRTLALAEKITGRPLFNAVISNVKGPRPLSMGGVPVVAVRSMGPVTRTLGLNMTAWSYRDDFSIGVQACREFLPDLRRLGDHLRDEMAAMGAALAGRASGAVRA